MNIDVYCNKIFIVMNIPLVKYAMYSTYKLTPIPIKLSDEIFTTISIGEKDVLLKEQQKRQYMMMTANEFTNCLFIESTNSHICDTVEPLISTNTDACFVQLLLLNEEATKFCKHRVIKISEQYFVKLITPNSWAFIMNKAEYVDEVCDMHRKERKHFLNGTGIITIQSGCTLITKKLYIESSNFNLKSELIIKSPEPRNISLSLHPDEIHHITVQMKKEVQDNFHLNLDNNLEATRLGKDLQELQNSYNLSHNGHLIIKWIGVNKWDGFDVTTSIIFGLVIISIIILIFYIRQRIIRNCRRQILEDFEV